MNKSITELKEKGYYRAVTTVAGELKSKLLRDCERGEKPAEILRQALKIYYSNKNIY